MSIRLQMRILGALAMKGIFFRFGDSTREIRVARLVANFGSVV